MEQRLSPGELRAAGSPGPPSIIGRRLGPTAIWLLVLLAVLGYLLVLPLTSIVWGSFRTVPPGVEGPLTAQNYVTALTSANFIGAVRNTAVFAILSTTLAMAMACYLAWLTERTDAPLRVAIYGLVFLPIIVPGVLTTIAWAMVLNPRNGIANTLLASAGFEPFLNGYSMLGMVWADATDSLTLPFLLMAAAFRAMDTSLEEASSIAGAAHRTTLLHVTLPLMTPAVLATALIVFVKTVDNFEVPAVLGLPAAIRVLATEVFVTTRLFPTDTNLAATYGVLYLLITVVGLALYYRATGTAEKFATITGRGYRPARIMLGRSRYFHAAAAMFIMMITVGIPFLVIIYVSFIPFYQTPHLGVLASMTLDNYRFVVFESPVVRRALVNNLVAGGLAALAAVALAAVISWVVIRTRLSGKRLLDALAFAPIAFPGVVIALALMWLYLTIPVPIYATLWIIGLAYLTAYLPYALRATHASMSQISVELEEASAVMGAKWRHTFARIIIPLMAPGLLVGFIYVFTRAFRALSIPMMLAGPGTEVLPVLIYDFYEEGRYPELNAMGVLMFGALLILGVVAHRVSRRLGRTHPEV